MIAVLQRVSRAQVDTGGGTAGAIGRGLLVLVCVSGATGTPVRTGVFGAMMIVSLANEGPVPIIVDSREGGVGEKALAVPGESGL